MRQAEEDALKRLVVFERQNPQGLIESVSKISGIGNVVKGVVSMNPADIARGVGELAIGKIQKSANDADNLIKKAFGAIEEGKKGFAPRSYLLKKLKDIRPGMNIQETPNAISEAIKSTEDKIRQLKSRGLSENSSQVKILIKQLDGLRSK